MSLLPLYNAEGLVEAGCDEAGRGCLAGPVFAAAVILPPDYSNNLLNDSKQLSLKKRLLLRATIEKDAVAYAVASSDNHFIDRVNILKASILTMHKAVDNLALPAEYLIIDGNKFYNYKNIPHQCIVKGDGKYLSIAAASILAKTYRDDFMENIHYEYPYYKWNKNKGYPTKEHRQGIKDHGACPYHRMSFSLLPKQLNIPFDK